MFGFSSRKTRLTVDRRQSLAAIPVLNEGVTFVVNEDGNFVIHAQIKRGTGFISHFQPPVMERTIKLDELGTFVFKQVDGNKSTLQIIEQFTRCYRTNRRESELSTVDFLKSLLKRGIISIAVR